MTAPKIYCTARNEVHACQHGWEIPGHPGDGTIHECHCGFRWWDSRYQEPSKPQLAYIVTEGSWTFSVSLHSTLETGLIFGIWFGRRGIHLPLRWRPWGRS